MKKDLFARNLSIYEAWLLAGDNAPAIAQYGLGRTRVRQIAKEMRSYHPARLWDVGTPRGTYLETLHAMALN